MIHTFSIMGKNIVIDVNSGAVLDVDGVAFDILKLLEGVQHEKLDTKLYSENYFLDKLSTKYSKDEISEAYSEVIGLVTEGQLFTEDYDEQIYNVKLNSPVVKALCLHISHDCNLRCKYCFAGTGSFGGDRIHMSAEVGKKAIDFLIKHSASRKNLEVDFFGGEPLLNFETVKDIVEYGRSIEKQYNKLFKFTITTNAVLLNDEIKEYINTHMHNVVLSIDGTQETNDYMRPRIGGQGTYEQILPKIMDVAESRGQEGYYVRGTFTSNNLDFSKDVLHLADLGFKQVSVEPVVANKESGLDLRQEHIPQLFSEYEKLAKEYVDRKKQGRGFNFFHFMIDLTHGPCVIKRLSGCGAGHEYMAVTPDGELYPCHQFVGMEDFKIGSVLDEGDKAQLDMEIQDRFKRSNIFTKSECSKCWAKFYCSGGCSANAYQFNGDINIPYEIGCELEKKRVECALWIQTQLIDDEDKGST